MSAKNPAKFEKVKKSRLLGYGLVPVLLVLATLIASLVHPFIPESAAYWYLAGVVTAAWIGGRGPGLLAAGLTPFVLDYYFLPPLHTWGIGAEARPYVMPFLLTALAAAWISSARSEASEANAGRLRDYEKFRALLMNLPDVTWTSDQFGRMIYISPKVEKILGFSKSEIYLGGAEFLFSRTHPDDVARIQAAAAALFAREKDFDVEFRFQRKDGEWVWIQNRAIGAYERDGVVQADGVISDVSPRKKAEIELREKTAFLEAQINSSIDGILVVDAKGRRIQANEQLVDIFGIPADIMANSDQFPLREHILSSVKDSEAVRALIKYHYENLEEITRFDCELIDGKTIDVFTSPASGPAKEYYGRIWIFRDITGRKKNEAELKAKTAFLEAQINANLDGILVVDAEIRRIQHNQRVIEMFDIPAELLADSDQIPAREHMLKKFKNPEQMRDLINYLYSHPEEASRNEFEFTDGRIIEQYSSPVKGAAGEYYGRIWAFRDITSRKKNEAALKAKTALLEAQVNASIDGILVVNEFGRRVLINQRFIDILGIPPEVLESDDDELLLSYALGLMADPESFLARVRHLNDHPVETSRDEIEFKDGRVFDRYSAPVIDKDWNYFGRIWNFRDITERKRSERELRQLSAAVEQSQVIVMIVDLTGNITYVNPKFTEVTGYSPGEVLGKNPRFLKSGHSPKEMYKKLWETIRRGKTWRGEFRNKKKNGELYWESATIAPIFDANGEMASFIAVKEDVSERRALESELRQAQKLEGIGQLAAGIAHEINTPTQFVTDNLTFLQESWFSAKPVLDLYRKTMGKMLPSLAPETLAEIVRAEDSCDLSFISVEVPHAIEQSLDGARRVAKIVRAMKEFSHPDSAEKSDTDLNRGILSTITVARNEWKYVAEMETDLDESLPAVFCYPGEVNQVILNLVVNAAHSIKDKVKDGEKGKIKVSTRNRGKTVEIAIADDGMGIPESIQSRIYEPFFTTKEVGKGTGQGLSFAHSVVVKKHQGKIWFETEVGKGTTFFLELPIGESNAAKESDAQTPAICR